MNVPDRNIILIGGGGHCKSVIDVAEATGWHILGILDTADQIGKDVLGYKVLGTDEMIKEYVGKVYFIVTVGFIRTPDIRIKLSNMITDVGGQIATVVAPDAYVSPYAKIGAGTVVMHKAVVNAGATVGNNCIINTFANIEHDAVIGDHCHVSTGAIINGDCRVGEKTFIGSGTILSNGIVVAERCLVGAGSFVRKDINTSGIYAGNPAKKYK